MLDKTRIRDYEEILTSTLLEVGGVECLARYEAIRVKDPSEATAEKRAEGRKLKA